MQGTNINPPDIGMQPHPSGVGLSSTQTVLYRLLCYPCDRLSFCLRVCMGFVLKLSSEPLILSEPNLAQWCMTMNGSATAKKKEEQDQEQEEKEEEEEEKEGVAINAIGQDIIRFVNLCNFWCTSGGAYVCMCTLYLPASQLARRELL